MEVLVQVALRFQDLQDQAEQVVLLVLLVLAFQEALPMLLQNILMQQL
jgi:hypothetical protein